MSDVHGIAFCKAETHLPTELPNEGVFPIDSMEGAITKGLGV